MTDLAQQVPEEWFDEISKKPTEKLTVAAHSFYQSCCPELIGNFMMELFQGESGAYFILRNEREPIGDYGSHWVEYWYKCNNHEAMSDLLTQTGLPEPPAGEGAGQ